MPAWLCVIARLNPLTHLGDALRGLMVHDEQSVYGLGFNCGIPMLAFVGLLAASGTALSQARSIEQCRCRAR
jgi:hypothetical protein